eukprot:CAMPEP_0183330908 /NCGR_PEP_ID=MMETSP0164_2-20130417/348_1 /TAXON_ID=221442 /ORGANISM="Coccolithus pelagicus ssp braarudi, Strain PLY182g" /LENGTH=178 /DNA_ID=CAMNT_0025499247 /DNA_START=610 /DNA_END=1146 /DNA_ORIENTATION=+
MSRTAAWCQDLELRYVSMEEVAPQSNDDRAGMSSKVSDESGGRAELLGFHELEDQPSMGGIDGNVVSDTKSPRPVCSDQLAKCEWSRRHVSEGLHHFASVTRYELLVQLQDIDGVAPALRVDAMSVKLWSNQVLSIRHLHSSKDLTRVEIEHCKWPRVEHLEEWQRGTMKGLSDASRD